MARGLDVGFVAGVDYQSGAMSPVALAPPIVGTAVVTAVGTSTVVVPPGARSFDAFVRAAGSGGNANSQGSNPYTCGAGGAEEVVVRQPCAGGESITVTVGAGGAAGGGTSYGGSGGASSVSFRGNPVVTAAPGTVTAGVQAPGIATTAYGQSGSAETVVNASYSPPLRRGGVPGCVVGGFIAGLSSYFDGSNRPNPTPSFFGAGGGGGTNGNSIATAGGNGVVTLIFRSA